jgi:hypothetical protein
MHLQLKQTPQSEEVKNELLKQNCCFTQYKSSLTQISHGYSGTMRGYTWKAKNPGFAPPALQNFNKFSLTWDFYNFAIWGYHITLV